MENVSDEIASNRACFSTDAGKRVLGDILIQAGYFDSDLSSEGEIAVQNFAKRIIRKLGIVNDPKDVSSYVQKLFELPSKGT